jgi:hypothetical protein
VGRAGVLFSIALSTVFSLVVGVVFGLGGSQDAADPIEALRFV